ncbi:NADPH-dependent FMN reductase [Aestuariimicrobium soli]|uniref:NADPH-dependent FMN reductase n=1 Tax=Aestuariimicrobium soli TaxID=2035834 RepID=UPI003EC1365C
MSTISVVIGSTRPVRVGEQVARELLPLLQANTEHDVRIVDLLDQRLPLAEETLPPRMGRYELDSTKAWAEVVDESDAFIFVSPEYNGGYAASLKNALDLVFAEWGDKPAGIVGYGWGGAGRATSQLAAIVPNYGMQLVGEPVGIAFGDNAPGENGLVADPAALVAPAAELVLTQLRGIERELAEQAAVADAEESAA